MSTTTPSEAQPANGSGIGLLRGLAIVHGAFNLIVGALLLAVPGRTLTFIAVLSGISLCLLGVFELARAFPHGLTGMQRIGQFGIGVLALLAGIVVIARPEGSVRAVVLVAGLYLVIAGATRLVVGDRHVPRRVSAVQGTLTLLVGIVLLAWPDVSLGMLAWVYGLFLIVLGGAEIVFAVAGRRTT